MDKIPLVILGGNVGHLGGPQHDPPLAHPLPAVPPRLGLVLAQVTEGVVKAFDRLVASIDLGSIFQMRIRVTGDGEHSLVHIEEWFLAANGKEWLRTPGRGFHITPDRAESLAAFLQTAVAAIKQEPAR